MPCDPIAAALLHAPMVQGEGEGEGEEETELESVQLYRSAR